MLEAGAMRFEDWQNLKKEELQTEIGSGRGAGICPG